MELNPTFPPGRCLGCVMDEQTPRRPRFGVLSLSRELEENMSHSYLMHVHLTLYQRNEGSMTMYFLYFCGYRH